MIFLVSMVPIVELRGAIPISQGFQLPLLQSYIICVIGNMLPVPIIYLFARRVLEWGKDKKYIGKFFTFCIEKGHKGGQKLKEKAGVSIYNLGTGNGYSVLDMVKAFSKACGKEIPYEIKPRRAGDIATCYCDATKAKNELHWVAERGLDEMCEDSWRWQSQNPDGYGDK